MIRHALSLALVLLLLGCKSTPLGPYVSPRVTGQVLAADTDQPLAGVTVARSPVDPRRLSQAKGAELLMLKAPVRTDANGRFDLASERVLSIVRGAGWNIVSLSFEHAGYRRFQTNCPTSSVTNWDSGEPVLQVGRVLLQPGGP